jgi:hypothetical protein
LPQNHNVHPVVVVVVFDSLQLLAEQKKKIIRVFEILG